MASRGSYSPPPSARKLNYKEGYRSTSGTTVQFHTDWMKSHQIEGDGLLPLLYHHLYKKDKDFKSCPHARIPDTVVYEHNFPRAWYVYEAKSGEITKRSGKYLDVHHINKFFSKEPSRKGSRRSKPIDIVAQYMYSRATEDGSVEMNVEFLSQDSLEDFLHNRRNRPDGVLQKFLIPKASNNTQIQAVFSNRSTDRVYKRTSKARLNDRTKTPYERGVTFDGPSHLSEESIVSDKVKEDVLSICRSFVDHFSTTEHKPISRMSLFFKMDEDDKLWILWGSSLRIGGTKYAPSTLRIPLNLATKFATSDMKVLEKQSTIRGEAFEEGLLSRDLKLYTLSRDFLFSKLHCCGDDAATRAQTARTRGRHGGEHIMFHGEDLSPRHPFYGAVMRREHRDQFQSTLSPRKITQGPNSTGAASRIPAPPQSAKPNDSARRRPSLDWYKSDATMRARYHQLCRDEDTVLVFVKDAVYALYSAELGHMPQGYPNPEPDPVEIPKTILDLLTHLELEEILGMLGLTRDEDNDSIAVIVEKQKPLPGTSSWSAPATPRSPVYHLLRESEALVRKIFDERKGVLQHEHEMALARAAEEDEDYGVASTS